MDYTVTGPKELSKSGKERTPVLHEGKAAWLYGENGSRSIRDDQGHWLARVENSVPITNESASTLHQRRRDKAQEMAMLGAMQAVEDDIELTLAEPAETWLHLTKARAIVAMDTQARGGNAAYELVGRATGFLASRNETQPAEANITLNKAGLAALVQAITAEQGKRDSIAGEWVSDDGSGE